MTALLRSPAPDRAFRRAAFPCREAAEPSARVPVSLSGDGAPRLSRSIDTTLVWLGDAPLATAETWLVEVGTRTVRAHFAAIAHADGDAASHGSSGEVEKHAVIRARLRLHEPVAVGTSATIDELHTLVVVDAATQRAVAAGSIDACDA